MKKISSGSTVFYKRLFPVAWFGFLAFFLVKSLTLGAAEKDLMFLVVPVFMAIFGYLFMRKLLWVLADEVYDCGDYLLVKNRGSEERIELANIMNVNASMFMNPPQVTLRLINPGRNGNEVIFSPAEGLRLNFFTKSAVAEDLIVRAHRARTGMR